MLLASYADLSFGLSRTEEYCFVTHGGVFHSHARSDYAAMLMVLMQHNTIFVFFFAEFV